jgi:site-specific DNA-methyltransferase (adenine-specific)
MTGTEVQIGDHRITHGECLAVMAKIPDHSIDFVLCDPPFGTINWKCPEKWDNVIPFSDMWSAYWRVLKPKGVIALFGNEPFSTLLKASQLTRYKYDYVWRKSRPGGFANAKVKPLKQYELISIFSEGTTSPGRPNNMPYYPQGLVRCEKKVKNSGNSRIGFTVRNGNPAEYVQEWTNYPGDVLEYANENGFHPTQKPVPLLEHLIRTYSTEGGIVLDNTMGSGSTGVAAAKSGRRFIGIEQEEKYFAIAEQRIREACPDPDDLIQL